MKTRASYLQLLIVMLALLPLSCKTATQDELLQSTACPMGQECLGQPPTDGGDNDPVGDDDDQYNFETERWIDSPCGMPVEEPTVRCFVNLSGEVQENRIEGLIQDPRDGCAPSDLSEVVADNLAHSTFTYLSDLVGLSRFVQMWVAAPTKQEELFLNWAFDALANEGCTISIARQISGFMIFEAPTTSFSSQISSGEVVVTHLKLDPKEGEQFEVSGKFEFAFPEGRVTGTFFGVDPYIYDRVP